MIEFKHYSDIPDNFNYTGICKVKETEDIFHLKDGKYHNESGPAIICKSGSKFWYINNVRHREDGPAEEYANGDKCWHYKGALYGYDNDFTNETWALKVSELKSKEI